MGIAKAAQSGGGKRRVAIYKRFISLSYLLSEGIFKTENIMNIILISVSVPCAGALAARELARENTAGAIKTGNPRNLPEKPRRALDSFPCTRHFYTT